ncbi:MAG: phosphopantetheine-binding protein, partial [Thermoplasmatota archaeon]
TGYPEDMLELDLDLEADLGIDTVKQVELFALARESFDLPRDDSINLQDLNTLRKIIEYVAQKSGVEASVEKVPTKEEAAAPEKMAEKDTLAPAEGSKEAPAPQTGDKWDTIRSKVVSIVAEKTGYPEDMLELDLDLEADLGIDTVKQVELFALARESFDLPRDDSINLQDLNTLRKIIEYVAQKSGVEASVEKVPTKEEAAAPEKMAEKDTLAPAEGSKEAPAPQTGDKWDTIRSKVVSIVAEKTGYPEDMLELDLDLEADLGIDTVKQVELFALARESFDLPRDDSINLQDLNTLRKIIEYVAQKSGVEASVEKVPTKEEAAAPEKMAEKDTLAPAEGSKEAPAPQTGDKWDTIRSKVVSIVAEKTGYPEDMLELDLDLEADLGIDTVKQVELFALARESFDLPRDDSINLQDLNTLRKIIEYVAQKSGVEASVEKVPTKEEAAPPEKMAEKETLPPAEGSKEAPAPETGDKWDTIRSKVVSIVAEKTGYPEDMLELDLDLEADLGIDTVKQVELFAMARESFDLPRDDSINLQELNTLRKIVDYVDSKGKVPEGGPKEDKKEDESAAEVPKLTEEQLRERINRWVLEADEAPAVERTEKNPADGRKALVIGGDEGVLSAVREKLGVETVHLPQGETSFDEEAVKDIEGIICIAPLFLEDDPDPENWDGLGASTSKLLFASCKAMDKRLKDGGFLYSITAMGGRFALDRSVNPFNGAVSGFTKAVGREYPDADVIALDVDPSMGLEDAVELLKAEVSRGDHPLEVGYSGGKRYLPAMRVIMQPQDFNLKFEDGMSILVSGGGGGITAEIIKGIAKRAKVKLHIVDIAELLPDSEELSKLDEEGLARKKEEIRDGLVAEGKKLTPVMIDREFGRITRSIGLHNLLNELRSLGAEPYYHRSDIRDGGALKKIADENGPFDGIIHAAGIEQSKSIISKMQEDFDRVFDIKVKGAKAVLDATREHPIRFFLTFTSVAGRFGNAGQVDYSSANDLLAKLRGALLKYHPDCTFKAVGWSAWAGVGMASKGAVKTLLEMGGITFIPVDDGIEYAISEILHGSEREVYYSGSLGPMDKGGVLKWSEGVHPPREVEVKKVFEAPNKGPAPLIDEIVERTDDKILVRRSLDGVRESFLPDHSIMGTMVLPGVMGLEIFGETASLLCPGKEVVELRDVRFKKAVNVKEGMEIFVEGGIVSRDDDTSLVELKVFSKLVSKKTKKEVQVEHYTGRVLMGGRSRSCQEVPDHPIRPMNVMARVVKGELYQHLFHGPLFQVLEGLEVLKDGELLGIYRSPGQLMHASTGWGNNSMVTAPMQTECGFQAAGAYVMDRFKMMALPVKVGSIIYHDHTGVSDNGAAWVRYEGREDNTFKFDVDFIDREGKVRFSYRDYQLKTLMTTSEELKDDHSVPFEEVISPVDEIRVFRIDLDNVPEDLEEYVRYFDEDEWKDMVREKMTQKRRREHTMGRVIAKLAVSWYLSTERGRVVPVREVKIKTEESGKPFAIVGGERVEISLSHSHRWAVCSVGGPVHGVDIELSEHRDLSFVDEAFSMEEAQLIEKLQKELDIGENMIQTLMFSAKEAYLKKTGLGMGADLRSVVCSEVIRLPQKGGLSFEVLIIHGEFEARVRAHIPSAYVLTVSV